MFSPYEDLLKYRGIDYPYFLSWRKGYKLSLVNGRMTAIGSFRWKRYHGALIYTSLIRNSTFSELARSGEAITQCCFFNINRHGY